MTTHAYGTLSFESPPSWRDQHVLLLSPATPRPGSSNIVMTRVARGGTKLTSYAWTQLVQLAKKLPAFSLIGTEEITVAGRQAIRARFKTGRGEDGGTVEEVVVFVDAPEGDVITLSCSWSVAEPSDAREVFDRMLVSARFTEQDTEMTSGTMASVPPPPSSKTLPGNTMSSAPFVPMPGERAARR